MSWLAIPLTLARPPLTLPVSAAAVRRLAFGFQAMEEMEALEASAPASPGRDPLPRDGTGP